MEKYKLTKLSDDKFNGNHLNLILERMQWVGHIHSKPNIGERFHFGTNEDHPDTHLWTSTVKEILDDGIFKTNNSTYKLEKIN